LVGINCSNLYESAISEKIYEFSQDPSHKAMFIAALKYETTRLRWFMNKPMGYIRYLP